MTRARKRYLAKWRADHAEEIKAYQSKYRKRTQKKKKVEVPKMAEKNHKPEEPKTNEHVATPASGGAPPKPEKGDTRLFQTAAGKVWLTKDKAKEAGFNWVD